ncbi:hypothetical protein Scep_018213 [Stephania cephalantha]|uniref:Uncharacterized protein n=1 Tax=Stephania cephalantha TaxID=152367 RepID=A0AAP0IRZ6_9MAGN
MTMEGSDSNSSSNMREFKRRRSPAESSASSGRYKGVVLQQNGHWGAQIYAKHQRIWLGTFKSDKEAAMAYDSAAVKLRNGDTQRNFPLNSLTLQEHNFQCLHTTDEILNMIKDGSYQAKFMDFVRTQSVTIESQVENGPAKGSVREGGFSCHQLFRKELTPSDVGKLNRLVIPKKHAMNYFPKVSEDDQGEGGTTDDVQLAFFDRQMKEWKFRYCYWKSSQSFVFTRGWNRFVKEKSLKEKDVVAFYRCESNEGLRGQQPFCMIDIEYNIGEKKEGYVQAVHEDMGTLDEEENKMTTKKKGFRLFGVEIAS